MNCECNNKSNRVKPGIKHVYGNVLRMAIPLTLRTLVKDGDEMDVTDTDFIPSSDHPVRVVFSKGKTNYPIIATMDGNVAIVEDKGKIPVGTYDISVECYDDLGNPYRFKQNAVLYVADTTAEAGIDEEIEYEAQTWYLNAAVFLATTEIGEIGDAIDAKLDDVFGNVAYDADAKEIRFYNKDNSRVLATIDSRPFIADGTVSDVYIDVSRQVLVVVLNEDAGGRMFSVPLYLVFNSYYKKDEVDNLVSRTVEGMRFDFSQELPLVVHVKKNGSSYSSPVDFGTIENAIREDGRLVVACVNNDIFYQLLVADRAEIAFSRVVALDGYQELLIVDPHNVWSMEDVDLAPGGGGGGYEPPAGGIPKTDLATGVQTSLGKADSAIQGVKVNGTELTPDANKKVDVTVPTKLSDLAADATHRVVTDAEKSTWSGKQSAINDLDTIRSGAGKGTTSVQTISVNGGTAQQPTNGVVNLTVAIAADMVRVNNDNFNGADLDEVLDDVAQAISEAGEVKSVTINGVTPPVDNNGNINLGTIHDGEDGTTPHIGQDGYWYIGTTNTGVKAQGERGNDGVASADECVVVNNLDGEPADLEEGQVAVLGAGMGKILSEMIEEGGDTIDISYNSSRKAIVITTASAPLVKAATPSRASLSCRAGSTDSVTFMVRGKRLMQPIAISVSDSINWQVSPTQVSPTQDGDVALTTITVTYRPASGTATGTQHPCVVTVSYNNETQSTINLQGEVLAAPTINVPSSLTINKYEGGVGSGVVRVSGVGLEGDVSLALSGSGFSFSDSATQTALTVSKADAIASIDVPVYFSGSEDTNGTLTASSTAAANAVTNLVGHIAVPAALDTEFTDNGLKYKVKAVASQNTHGELKLINPDGESSTTKSTYSGEISIPATIEKDGFVYDVVSIGNYAFYRANGVTSVVIGDNVTNIGSQAFAECTSMTSLIIGNGVTTISANAFSTCFKLSNITIGNSVTTIGSRAFSMAGGYTGSLLSITLPDSVTSLGDYVFSGRASLTTVKIGTTIGCQMSSISSAFYNCSGIVKVTCYATSVPSISATADSFMPASSRTTATLEVPSASKSNYESDSKWGTFGNITAITE